MTKDSTRKWLFSLFVGLIVWSFLYFMHFYWYTPWCAVNPTPCMIDHVNAFDRIVFQFHSVSADFWSNVVQNFVGLIVFVAPWAIFSRKIALEETMVTATVSVWNLAWMEAVRALVQRPRPAVFNNVFGDGANIQNYNSFYSGHTSFVALASLCFFFMIKRRYPRISSSTRKLLFFGFAFLTLLTGTLRILGGRHYPSDVIAGLIVGVSICLYFQKKLTWVGKSDAA